MSVLILSPDENAAHSLGSALQRRGVTFARELRSLEDTPPLVVVLDTATRDYAARLREIRERAPWARCYLMAERGAVLDGVGVPVIQKPFDAAAMAQVLEREQELAAIEHRQRNLAAHADELGLLLESSFEAIVGLDEHGTIVFWNRGAERTYGYTAAEALGRDLRLLGDEEVTPVSTVDRKIPATHELTRRHKDGQSLLVLVSRSRAADDCRRGRLECAEVSLDITERRAFEREFEHAQRLAQLGRMAATLSHEVNNPLAVIRSNAGWLSAFASRAGDEELGEVAADLEHASERIATFVDSMTGFARRGTPQLEHAPLTRCLGLALRMVRPRADSHRVRFVHEPDQVTSAPITHDPTRFSHALINVLSNAVDAAAQGGGHVWLRVQPDDDHCVVVVEDDGPGISSEHLGRVFEPFYTTKPFGQGTGLGLWLTQQIVSDHAGRIQLEPRAGGGTRVELRLPRRPQQRETSCSG